MDKISAALIAGIVGLICISSGLVYHTWIKVPDQLEEIEAVTAEEPAWQELIFNEDTSITNNGNRTVWLRVKVFYQEPYSQEEYQMVSKGIEKGSWKQADDQWYYYHLPVDFAQTTDPLIDQLLYQGRPVMEGTTGRFRLQVEAVDEAWLMEKPENGYDAFLMLHDISSDLHHSFLDSHQ